MTLDDIRKRVLYESMPWSEPSWTGTAWKWQWTRTKQYELDEAWKTLRTRRLLEGTDKDWPDDEYAQVGDTLVLTRPLKCALLIRAIPGLAVFDTWEVTPYPALNRQEFWVEKDQVTLDWAMTAWRFALGVTDATPHNLMGT